MSVPPMLSSEAEKPFPEAPSDFWFSISQDYSFMLILKPIIHKGNEITTITSG